MKNILMTASALALCATAATAGGIERSSQSVGILFEEGNYIEFNAGRAKPNVSGVQEVNAGIMSLAGSNSGDMAENYNTYSLSAKFRINDKLDFALVLDEPVGADVYYPMGSSLAGFNYLYGGSTADINSLATTAMLRYKLPNNFSVIGGIRQISTSGTVALFNGYRMSTDTQTDYGYLIGVAWEKPEIAARVALTYNSAVTHRFNANEVFLATPALNATTVFETEIPQSVNLEGQTGIAANTLLFGSIRWVDWSAFEIAPQQYMAAQGLVPGTNPATHSGLVSYDDDSFTYTLGIGRKFNETWSGAVFVSHETSKGGYAGNLGPTDGQTALGVAATYTRDNLKVTAGVRYVKIGGASTETPEQVVIGGGGSCSAGGDCGTFASFEDNHAVAFGLRVGYRF
ncbi:long-subunit fatty acid transport protein [Rhodobacter aestuarii]|uniref:Long-chain fatty acid transport protein n=1 Tax=Rhodobacter aestuarii TaxID=453582 RepID=A0A1N7Q0G3_9RHOB|nr:hypothetical protein [Rhodobacter aestuarii]PTV93996.1 long-subunit fatty acid transport protein [Rhodobacter aestuarii]SIT16311.1 Long-chain fatty acid transport protein [Rhodobacter aestuarii]